MLQILKKVRDLKTAVKFGLLRATKEMLKARKVFEDQGTSLFVLRHVIPHGLSILKILSWSLYL